MNKQNNNPHWKELADNVKELNMDYYWRTLHMIHERPVSKPLPPPRLCVKTGISMTMRHEHTPPVFKKDEEQVLTDKSNKKG